MNKYMKKFKTRNHRLALSLIFTLVVGVYLFFSALLTYLGVYLIIQLKYITKGTTEPPSQVMILLIITIANFFVGILMTFIFSKIPLKPVNNLINKMNMLASGDFKTRIKFTGLFSKTPIASELSDSFNKMAEELDNTEVLRRDFINNFSHEFKTPISSISGFARLLKKDNLTLQQKKEYIDIIEEESMRLSYMAENILNLTKIENQTILSDVSEYNLSEQIRNCILILENKWSAKNLEFSVDFGEHTISANEELLKQVWINLIDNAIKFSFENSTIEISIKHTAENIIVMVINSGNGISDYDLNYIFNRFYQADKSRATDGNGIGLTIVKKITELHNGTVSVASEGDTTMFSVKLPIRHRGR